LAHHGACRFVDGVAGAVELEIGHRAGWRANRFAVHAPEQDEQCAGGRKGAQDERPILRQQRVVNGNDTAVIRAEAACQFVQRLCRQLLLGHCQVHRRLFYLDYSRFLNE
jgi:hypothetical protein